ncbi:MAG: hypothetical protein H8K03_21295 [Nitrospira sp.]
MLQYRGRQLETIAKQQADGRWTGYYVISDYTETVVEGNKGHADCSYRTREEAEAAALGEGERVLDSRPPLP